MKKIMFALLVAGCGGPPYEEFIQKHDQEVRIKFPAERLNVVLPQQADCVWRMKEDLTWVCIHSHHDGGVVVQAL